MVIYMQKNPHWARADLVWPTNEQNSRQTLFIRALFSDHKPFPFWGNGKQESVISALISALTMTRGDTE